MSVSNLHRFCVAPMMDWTDRHCRYFLRILSRNARLYTEMVTTGALLFGNRDKLLGFSDCEHPLAAQLGGSDPQQMTECAKIVEQYGYDEVNINVGCPSDRVQSGRFGACLMREPQLVAECVHQMSKNVQIPVTVKCRIGVDDQEEYASLQNFISLVASAGCNVFLVHARKAWLKGLSPKENREKPPLRYDIVQQLKLEFPQLSIVLNGGIRNLDECQEHLTIFDGVMLGRAAYEDPYALSQVDSRLFNVTNEVPTRMEVLQKFLPYALTQNQKGVFTSHMARHLVGLYYGIKGARDWRRCLTESSRDHKVSATVILEAAALAEQHWLNAA